MTQKIMIDDVIKGIFEKDKKYSVGRSLNLSNTPITSSPDSLSVGGHLYLSDTKIMRIEKENLGQHERVGCAFFLER